MNKKGFTLVELLATIVVLGIVISISVVGIRYSIRNAKEKTEKVFIKTLRDAIEIYLDDADIDWTLNGSVCKDGSEGCSADNLTSWYVANNITFDTIINSPYHPITEDDLKNPATGKVCDKNAEIKIYKDADEIYYYDLTKVSLGDCLLDTEGNISNLP